MIAQAVTKNQLMLHEPQEFMIKKGGVIMQELLNLQELSVSGAVEPALSLTSCDSNSCNIKGEIS